MGKYLKIAGKTEFSNEAEAINQLLTPPERPKKKIGFIVKEKRTKYSSN